MQECDNKVVQKSASSIGSTGRFQSNKDEEITTRKDELLEENGYGEILEKVSFFRVLSIFCACGAY